MIKQHYDIIIVGGGLVGTSLVCALQKQGLSIAVLEKSLPSSLTDAKTDGRPISLAHTSQVILNTLGIWSQLAELASPIQTVHVSTQGAFGTTQFHANDFGLSALGYVLPFAMLQQSLYQAAAGMSDVDFICCTEIKKLVTNNEGVNIQFTANNKQHTLSAKLLVAADGTHSICRQLLTIPVREKNLDDRVLTAILTLKQPHQFMAFERFTKNGTLALLPMWENNQYRFVWTSKNTVIEKALKWESAELLQFINSSFGGRICGIKEVKVNGHFPIKMVIAKQQTKPSSILLGNAAHTIYPIAAQGFNLGLRDVSALADLIAEAVENQTEINAPELLQRYQQWRESDQNKTIGLTNRISLLFDFDIPLVNRARGFGLLALDIIPIAKRQFASRLLGRQSKLPRLSRGIPLWL